MDETGFVELYERHEADLGRFLFGMLRSRGDAEEALQEVWATAWKQRDRLDRHEDPRAWLFTVARHRALRELRRSHRVVRLITALGHRSEATPGPARAVEVADLLARTLSPQDRSLFVLRYAHGFTSAELAHMSGLSAVAVRQRLRRARERLDPPSSPAGDVAAAVSMTPTLEVL